MEKRNNKIFNVLLIILIVEYLVLTIGLIRKIVIKRNQSNLPSFSIVADGYYNESGRFVEECRRITISPINYGRQ